MKTKPIICFIHFDIACLFFVILILPHCKPKEPQDVDGGPCSYQSDSSPAKVVDIYPTNADSSFYEIAFAIERFETPDTLYYSSEFSRYASRLELDSIGLILGKSYIYEHRSITSGHCSPDIFSLILYEYP